MFGSRRGPLVVVLGLHAALVASIVAQPLDPHVPARSSRFITAPLYFDAKAWPGPGVDFFALYHAGIQVRRGTTPYARDEHPRATPYYFRYLYSPAVAQTLGRVATLLTPRAAYVAWVGAIELCLAMSAVILWRRFGSGGLRDLVLAILLLSTPYALELHVGQFTFVSVALLLAGVVRASDHRAGNTVLQAATLVAFGGAVKSYLVVTLPAFAAPARARRAGAGLLVVLALIACTVVWTPGQVVEFVTVSLMDDAAGPVPGNLSTAHLFRPLLLAAGHPWNSAPSRLLAPAMIAVALAGATVHVLRHRTAAIVSRVCVLLFAFTLSYFRISEHYYSSIVLAGAYLLAEVREEPVARRLTLASVILLALPSPYILFPADPRHWPATAAAILPLSKIAPTALLCAVAWRATSGSLGTQESSDRAPRPFGPLAPQPAASR